MTNTQSTNAVPIKAFIEIFFDSGTQTISCRFNPKEYTISRRNNWKSTPAKNKDIGHPDFEGGSPATINLQLLFDDYDIAKGDTGTSIEESTKLLWKALRVQDTKKQDEKSPPPECQFRWGTVWSFRAVITSLSQKFIMFNPVGKPLRAIIDIGFTQIQEDEWYPRQNPTSGGGAGERIRIVRAGDTLAGIAFEEYGDPTVWRHLADTNKIRNPLSLSPGQTLLITSLSLV